jgi:CRP/FNR family transcriptional regulator, cyclic AMP receptor protein
VARRPRRSGRRSREAKLELLSEVPLFSSCTKRELSRIASLTDQIEVPEGRVLTRQGEPGWDCFVIVDGHAKAAMRGRRAVKLGPGSFFGEMSLLDRGPRSATVTAETDMHLLVLGSRDFSALLVEVPTVARRMLQVLAERLREAEQPQPQH